MHPARAADTPSGPSSVAKKSGYTPTSKAAATVVSGRTFGMSPAMRKGAQQKGAPKNKTT